MEKSQHCFTLPNIKYNLCCIILSQLLPPAKEVWGKVIFYTCLSFCLQGGVCLSACWDTTPPWSRHHPPGADTPQSRHPCSRHPPGADPPWDQTILPEQTPPGNRPPACWEIRSTRGRYASYWNAILYWLFIYKSCKLCFS